MQFHFLVSFTIINSTLTLSRLISITYRWKPDESRLRNYTFHKWTLHYTYVSTTNPSCMCWSYQFCLWWAHHSQPDLSRQDVNMMYIWSNRTSNTIYGSFIVDRCLTVPISVASSWEKPLAISIAYKTFNWNSQMVSMVWTRCLPINVCRKE